MKQQSMIRYLHMGCGESLAARQLGDLALKKIAAARQLQPVPSADAKKRRKPHEEQR
ncbi:hypothetical protein [Thiolapillus sp.]